MQKHRFITLRSVSSFFLVIYLWYYISSDILRFHSLSHSELVDVTSTLCTIHTQAYIVWFLKCQKVATLPMHLTNTSFTVPFFIIPGCFYIYFLCVFLSLVSISFILSRSIFSWFVSYLIVNCWNNKQMFQFLSKCMWIPEALPKILLSFNHIFLIIIIRSVYLACIEHEQIDLKIECSLFISFKFLINQWLHSAQNE